MLCRAAIVACLALALAVPAAAEAQLVRTNVTGIPYEYLQGVASDGRSFWFVGPDYGLAHTSAAFRQTSRVDNVIPAEVRKSEDYNHIGDPDWESAEGGRVLLPLECFWFGRPEPNTCRTGSIGVADPATLRWRYYVKLDPAVIPKAMWVAASADGLLWTSAGDDLLAFRSADVNPANAAPGGPAIGAVRQVPGAVAGIHVAGGAFHSGRLYLAGTDKASGAYLIRSFDPVSATTRPEVEHRRGSEAEGLDASGGVLRWVVGGAGLGSPNELLQYHPVGAALRLRVSPRVRAARRARVTAVVTSLGAPVSGATVRLAGRRARTGTTGRAVLSVPLPRAGRYRVRAERAGLRTAGALLRVTSR